MQFQNFSPADLLAANAAAVWAGAMGLERRITALASATLSSVVAGFAYASIALTPEFYVALKDVEGVGPTGNSASTAWRTPPPRRGAAGVLTPQPPFEPRRLAERSGPPWVQSFVGLTLTLAARWRRAQELRRLRAAWDTVDDRTLKDIGVTRHAIAQLDGERHWR